VGLFRGKHLTSFIENLSHEGTFVLVFNTIIYYPLIFPFPAWITSNLLSSQPSAIREVMNRLRNVPVVPPLESLRHIGAFKIVYHLSVVQKFIAFSSCAGERPSECECIGGEVPAHHLQ
jgi:hypothetical protein